jgi:MoaA/NifB/PqqE/SkfB family radical SAM enzyme
MDMTSEVLIAVRQWIKRHDIYSINIYGGEPFLSIELFNRVYQSIYDAHYDFFISTNGSFMAHKAKREYVYNLLRIMSYNSNDCTGIRISNSKFHAECRTPRIQRGFEQLQSYIKCPEYFWDDYPGEYNPFYNENRRSQIYIEDENSYQSGMNPSGRALKNADITDHHCYCLMTTSYVEEGQINIRPNGDIQICCTCDGCIVGNILEPDLSEKILTARITRLREHFAKRYQADRNTRMVDLCEICHRYRIDDKGIRQIHRK